MGYRGPRPRPVPRAEQYRPYDSVVWDLPAVLGVCTWCGTEGETLSTRDPCTSPSCRWCRELSNLRHHRWQQAAALHRSHRWMVQHDALPDRNARPPLPRPPRGPGGGSPAPAKRPIFTNHDKDY